MEKIYNIILLLGFRHENVISNDYWSTKSNHRDTNSSYICYLVISGSWLYICTRSWYFVVIISEYNHLRPPFHFSIEVEGGPWIHATDGNDSDIKWLVCKDEDLCVVEKTIYYHNCTIYYCTIIILIVHNN